MNLAFRHQLTAALLCGTGLTAGSVATLVWGPQQHLTEAIALLLLVIAMTGLWIVVSATHAVVHGPHPEPEHAPHATPNETGSTYRLT